MHRILALAFQMKAAAICLSGMIRSRLLHHSAADVPLGGVGYSFTNVGNKSLAAGTATLSIDTNVALTSAAIVNLPGLAPGGTMADWQLQVGKNVKPPVGFGHYQVTTNTSSAQNPSLDEIFTINAATPNPPGDRRRPHTCPPRASGRSR